MIGGIKKIGEFVRKETVLTVALLLAVISAFIVPPDSAYVDYIDFRTLAILFQSWAYQSSGWCRTPPGCG